VIPLWAGASESVSVCGCGVSLAFSIVERDEVKVFTPMNIKIIVSVARIVFFFVLFIWMLLLLWDSFYVLQCGGRQVAAPTGCRQTP